MELLQKRHNVSRELLNKSMKEVPKKSRANVLLECSRLEEFFGNIDRALDILARGQSEARHDWKVL